MANLVDKVIKTALEEVGYLEKRSNAQLFEKTANAGSANYTKYWKELASGMQGQPWCNCFVNWCFVKSYGESTAKKLLYTSGSWSYYTPTSASYFKKYNQWYTNSPRVGDVIYFKNSTRIHHVGMVYQVDNTYVYTIEGNTSSKEGVVANGGCVATKKYSLNSACIAGYGRPQYDTEKLSYTRNGLDYSPVFDTSYYMNKYPDLKAAFGNDKEKLFAHFLTYGIKEGRQAAEVFNVLAYKLRYSDLQKAFGNNLSAYYKHYIEFGRKEGRKGN